MPIPYVCIWNFRFNYRLRVQLVVFDRSRVLDLVCCGIRVLEVVAFPIDIVRRRRVQRMLLLRLHFILMYRESEIQLRIARSTRSTRRIPRTRCSLRRGSRTRGSCVTDGQRRGGPGSTLAFADAVGVLGSVAFPTGGARGARGGVLRSGRVVF